jgi:hypothetical protein
MVILIDESGTHRQDGFSVIALVCLESAARLDGFDKQIETIEEFIGTKSFHWADRGWPFRRDFIKELARLNFTIRIAQLANPVQLDRSLEEILPFLIPERAIEQMFIDGKKPKAYGRAVKKVLRDKGITVKKLKTVNDQSYPGIRAADAVAGAFRYFLDNPNKKAEELNKLLESHVEFVHVQKK